ncbi:MAG: transcriptional regulator, partial [Vitreoscilla sp.]
MANKKGLNSSALATALGLQQADLDRLLEGVLPITPTRAEKLSATVGASQRFWLARESQYQQDRQALQEDAREWVSSLPLADMRKFGWLGGEVPTAERLRRALDFFGVSNVDEWRDAWLSEMAGVTAYRTSPAFASEAASVAAWLRQGDLLASQIDTARWSRQAFERLLPTLKPLTRIREPSEFLPRLQSACAACGVAVVVARAPKGCPASGATRVKDGHAKLQLSFRFLRDDSFWFTFFHEAGHLILHED